LSGCVFVVGAKPVSLPDGTQGYAIRCNGAARDISDCMNEAARVCGGKYKIFGSDQNDVGGVSAPVGNGAIFVRGIQRTMLVSCGAH
jgi:hypothetical protein